MATNDIPFTVSQKVSEGLVSYLQNIKSSSATWNMRTPMERIDIAYQRELDLTDETIKARLAQAGGDITKIPNMQVPIIKPQVESAKTYLTSVFLTGYPIFGIAAGPDNADLAEQYNAILVENSIRGGWAREIGLFFNDGLKYNIHGLKVSWEEEKIYSPDIDPTRQEAKPKELVWAGNKLTRMDMYNTFFDYRCPPAEVHKKGDYVGYHEIYTKNRLKDFIQSLPYKSNVSAAFNSAFDGSLFYVPKINQTVWSPSTAGFNWDAWLLGPQSASNGVNYSGAYTATHLYARIVPADLDMQVAARSQVQIWYFIIINGKHVIYAERQTNLHKFLPIVIGQPLEDGLGLQTKAFAEDIKPYQDIASGLWNSRMAAARRRISDRMLYNPKFVKKSDINSPEPTAKIPVSLPSYATSLDLAVKQIPFEDSAAATFQQEVNAVMDFSFFASGQNRVTQGQFQKGNKTVHEFDTTMGGSNGRNQAMAIYIENQTFVPVKEMLKLNIVQYAGDGEIFNPVDNKTIKIKAEDIRKRAVSFKMSDGLIPKDKILDGDEFNVGLQTIQAVPALQQGYDIVRLFSYMMKARGAEGFDKFEKSPLQLQYEQQLASWQQIAQMAVEKGQQVPPQPQPSPELQQEIQAKQQATQAQQEQPKNQGI